MMKNRVIIDGVIWYSEKEINELKDKLKDMEAKYEYAKRQNNAVFMRYEAALNRLKELKGANND